MAVTPDSVNQDTQTQARELGRVLAMSLPRLGGGRPANGPIQVVDLFCGAGGLSVGFETFGRHMPNSYRLVAAVDHDADSVATYSRNLPLKALQLDLGSVKRTKADLQQLFGISAAQPLIVLGGPPCQGFSAHRKKARALGDVRNSLVQVYGEICAALEPDFVVFENVPEVTGKKYWHEFAAFRGVLEGRGYFTKAKIHNLAGFGVPQARFRTLMLASKKPFAFPEPFLRPAEFRTVREAIGHLPDLVPGEPDPADSMHVCSRHKQSTIATLDLVPRDGGSRPKGVGPRCLQEVDGFRDVYGRLFWDRPANTITAFARNPASGRYAHPVQNRGLSIREAALLQSFPADYTFEGRFDGRFLQVGNAVPPAFATYLAAHLYGEMTSHSSRPWTSEDDVREPTESFSSGLAARKRAA